MKCSRCQAENDAGARFCEDCGARLETACPSCGTAATPGKKFCRSCGAALTTEPAGRFASPDSYTPTHLAEKILTSKAALEGERKQVTVLFADLKGSMEVLAGRDPEEARSILDPVLERMMESVHRYEGTVNQVMGDGIMALFGAPIAHEDHALRACHAALAMQKAIRRDAEAVRESYGIDVRIRVGLNSGEVVVRTIGSDLRMDYSAVGQTTHLAARMEQLAVVGTILVAPATRRLVEDFVALEPRGPVEVKGLVGPIEVFELTGARGVLSRLHASVPRGLSSFVGRDAEMGQLQRALEDAGTGRGQVVAVVGEPGVGKSRLYWEFSRVHCPEDWLVVQSASVSHGKASAYLPVIELLKDYFRIDARDDPRNVREKVTERLASVDRALDSVRAAFLALLDTPVDDSEWKSLEPPERRQRTLDGVKRLLLREAQVQPVLVVFEDLHWIDGETQALLDGLVDGLPTARLLLLVNYRPEYQHRWGSKTYYRQIRIDPLLPGGAEELVTALLGEEPALEPLKRRLIDRTEGNPFFLEESVRTLIETNVLVGAPGAYRLTTTRVGVEMPPTVQAMLAARIDRLGPDNKRLLHAASVVGKDIPFAVLRAIADEPEERLRRGLAELQAAEFLYETGVFPDAAYTFKHALTHEVAYGSVLVDTRRRLHAAIVAAIERLHAERLSEHLDALTHHALRSETWAKAADYLQQAGTKAAGVSAYREAATHLEQALTALARLGESRENMVRACDLRMQLWSVLWPLGEFDAMLDHVREAERLAQLLDDQPRRAGAARQMANYFLFVGDLVRCVETGERALAITTTLGNVTGQIGARYLIGVAHHARGDYRRAAERFRANVSAVGNDVAVSATGHPASYNRVHLGRCLAELGDFSDAIASGDEAVRIAERHGHPLSQSIALSLAGFPYLRKGEFAAATILLERAMTLCREGKNAVVFPMAASHLGYAYALSGRVSEALPLLDDAVERSASMGRMDSQSLRIVMQAEGYRLAGRQADALRLVGDALDMSRRHQERGHEAWALQLLGEIFSRPDRRDVGDAEAHYRPAMELATELGMRPLVAHCHFGLGKLYRRTGKRQQAQEHLATATSMYREMDMRFWQEQAEADSNEGL